MSVCCTQPCLDELKIFLGSVNYNLLLDKGFVEDSTVNGSGFICKLLQFVETNEISAADTMLIIDRVLDKGFVWYCGNQTVIASVETYLKYAEAVGLTVSATIPT